MINYFKNNPVLNTAYNKGILHGSIFVLILQVCLFFLFLQRDTSLENTTDINWSLFSKGAAAYSVLFTCVITIPAVLIIISMFKRLKKYVKKEYTGEKYNF